MKKISLFVDGFPFRICRISPSTGWWVLEWDIPVFPSRTKIYYHTKEPFLTISQAVNAAIYYRLHGFFNMPVHLKKN